MLVSAVTEVANSGDVLPFPGLLVAHYWLFSQHILVNLTQAWGNALTDQLVMQIVTALVTKPLVSGSAPILSLWASNRIAFAFGAVLGIGVHARISYQP